MRLSTVFFAALAFVSLVGCGGNQPRVFRISLDRTPEKSISNPSCYKDSRLPGGGTTTEVNYREERYWVIWDGVDAAGTAKQFLDLARPTFKLGDSPTITVTGLVEGSDRTFSAQRNITNNFPGGIQATETRQTIVTVTFSDLNNTPTGTVSLNAQYACVPGQQQCPTPNPIPDSVSCQTTLNWSGRKIEGQQIIAYQPEGQ